MLQSVQLHFKVFSYTPMRKNNQTLHQYEEILPARNFDHYLSQKKIWQCQKH